MLLHARSLILHSEKYRNNAVEELKRRNISVIIVLLLLIGFTASFAQAANRYSVANGNWNSTSTWSASSGGAPGASYPVAGDVVYIERGYTVSITATGAVCATLTIGTTTAGTLTFAPTATANFTLTVSGDISIASNGSFTVTNYSGYNAHTLNIGGNLTVNGTFNMISGTDDYAGVVFNGSAQQTISGDGATCTLYSLTASNTNSAGLVLGRNVVMSPATSYNLTPSVTVTANDIFDLSSYTCDRSVSGNGTFAVNAGATLMIGGTNTFPANYNTNTLNSTSTVEYYGTAQTVRALTYGNLTLSGSDVKTLAGTTSIVGDLTVSGGTFDLASYTANRSAAGGTLTVSNGATLKIGGTGTIPSNYSTHSIGSTSTIEYAGTDQSVAVLNSSQDYGNLTISGSGTKTLAGSETVSGTLSVQGTATFSDGGNTLSYGASASLSYTGSSAQSTGAEFPSSIPTLIINNANGLTLNSSATINNTLTLTSGTITLGSNSLTIASGGSISGGSSSSYIVTNGTGVLTRNNVGASNVVFPAGTSSTYTPVTINNAGTSDNFSVRVQSTFDSAPPDPDKAVDRQWTITEGTAGGSNATITLQWNTADEAASFVRTNPIYIGRHNGSQWIQTAATYADLGGGVYTASASGFTSFSPFGVGNDGALPIQMASFAASVVRDNDVEVTWKTVSEMNNYGFEIQRKRGDSSEWLKIDFVEGHGTTLAPQSYSYIDRALTFGKYFYRIKQIDLDGKSETFPEMEVTVGVTPDTFVLAQNYPNPFNPSTQIEFVVPQRGFVTMKVYNVLGQEVATLFEGNAEAGEINMVRFSATGGSAFGGNAPNLPSGLYFYTLRSAGKIETKRMILMK
jgi:hypothetical protein